MVLCGTKYFRCRQITAGHARCFVISLGEVSGILKISKSLPIRRISHQTEAEHVLRKWHSMRYGICNQGTILNPREQNWLRSSRSAICNSMIKKRKKKRTSNLGVIGSKLLILIRQSQPIFFRGRGVVVLLQ